MWTLVFLTAAVQLGFSLDREHFATIDVAKQGLSSNRKLCKSDKVQCYDNLGCFSTRGPMAHTNKLPYPPSTVNTTFFVYFADDATRVATVDYDRRESLKVVPEATRLAVLVHGFSMDSKNDEMQKLKGSLLREVPIVIMVDWAKGAAAPWYTEAATNTQLVGRQVALLVHRLRIVRGIEPLEVHLLGFSLGAQVCGFAGKWSRSEFGWRFGRISGLDAAAPLFEGHPGAFLTKEDAVFVDAIHTSAGDRIYTGEVGFVAEYGHVDFYPNGGAYQPRCSYHISLSCNHYSSVVYMDASLAAAGDCAFEATSCASWEDFLADKCNGTDQRMGYYCVDEPGRGAHFLGVISKFPFCENFSRNKE